MKIAIILFIPKVYGGAQRRLGRDFYNIDLNKLAKVDFLLVGKETNIDYFLENEFPNQNFTYLKVSNRLNLAFRLFLNKYDWICFYDCGFHLLPSLIVSKLTRTKSLMIVASYFLAYNRIIFLRDRLIFRFFGSVVNHIDTLYPSSAEWLKLIFKKTPITVTPIPFIDKRKFNPTEKENIIFFSSRLESFKNPILLIEAINIIKKDIVKYNYKIIIAGDGPLYSQINFYINKYNLNEIVSLTGYIDSSSIVKKSKIFISIQSFENYPSQSLLEAIASGNYIIASNVGSTDKIVKSNFGELINLNLEDMCVSLIRAIKKTDTEMNKIILNSVDFSNSFSMKNSSVNYFYKIFINTQV